VPDLNGPAYQESPDRKCGFYLPNPSSPLSPLDPLMTNDTQRMLLCSFQVMQSRSLRLLVVMRVPLRSDPAISSAAQAEAVVSSRPDVRDSPCCTLANMLHSASPHPLLLVGTS
jgi:hypothetical protein